jgi:hypothetical protein
MIVEISPEKAYELTDRVADFIVKRRMASPAIMAIESLKPLHFLGSQALYFLAPFAELIFSPKEYEEFAAMLEHREYVELLVNKIERLDEEMYSAEREEAKRKRNRRGRRFRGFFGKLWKKNKGRNPHAE